MRSIDGPGAVSGRFVDYDAITNPNGTVYTADFGNDLQDELIGIQELASLTESAGTNLQVIEALKILLPGFNPDVLAWAAGTFTAGETTKHLGWFWFCGANSTTDEPGAETDWVRCSPFSDKLEGWKTAGWIDIADPKSANFKDYYQVGRYTVGGVDYQRYRLNISGQTTVLKTSDFGKLVEQSKNVSLFATDNGSDYDLEDYSGCVVSAGDASGGDREANGTQQTGAVQEFIVPELTGTGDPDIATRSDDYVRRATSYTVNGSVSFGGPGTDAIAGIPEAVTDTLLTADETRMKNVSNGCGYIEVDVAAGTILTVAG